MKNILFCGKKEKFDGILTSMLSILKRSDFDNEYTFYIYTINNEQNDPIVDKQIEFLNDIAVGFNASSKVVKIDVTDIYNKEYTDSKTLNYYSSTALMRMLVDLVPNMPEKLLYVDANLIFNKDINMVYDINIDNFEFGVGHDLKCSIDSEIVLLNLKKIKENNTLVKTREIVKNNEVVSIFDEAVVKVTDNYLPISKYINKEKVLQNKNIIKEFLKVVAEKRYSVNDDKVLNNKKFSDIYEEYKELKNIYFGYYTAC